MNVPFMPARAWGSHWNVYLPFLSVTVQVVLALPETDVFLFRPGPNRWKLCVLAVSLTAILYLPALSFVTFLPPFVSLIVKLESGPTLATSFGVAAELPAAATSAATPAALMMRRRDMTLLESKVRDSIFRCTSGAERWIASLSRGALSAR